MWFTYSVLSIGNKNHKKKKISSKSLFTDATLADRADKKQICTKQSTVENKSWMGFLITLEI